MRATTLRLGSRTYDIEHRALVLAVLDDPAAGGPGAMPGTVDLDELLRRADGLVGDGADLLELDLGSRRDGRWTPDHEEVRRMITALVARVDVPVGVAAATPAEAIAGLAAGASLVTGAALAPGPDGGPDPDVLAVAAACGATLALVPGTHRPDGTPAPVPTDDEAVRRAHHALAGAVERAMAAGVDPASLVLDAGVDRESGPRHALALLRATGRLTDRGHPVLLSSDHVAGAVGSFRDPAVAGSDGDALGATSLGVALGCRIVRARDAVAHRQACAVLAAVDGKPTR